MKLTQRIAAIEKAHGLQANRQVYSGYGTDGLELLVSMSLGDDHIPPDFDTHPERYPKTHAMIRDLDALLERNKNMRQSSS